jgi:hypothetical protein
MSINKKIIHFKHESDFKNKIDNNEIQDSSIVFIKDSNKIYTHGEEYSFVE